MCVCVCLWKTVDIDNTNVHVVCFLPPFFIFRFPYLSLPFSPQTVQNVLQASQKDQLVLRDAVIDLLLLAFLFFFFFFQSLFSFFFLVFLFRFPRFKFPLCVCVCVCVCVLSVFFRSVCFLFVIVQVSLLK